MIRQALLVALGMFLSVGSQAADGFMAKGLRFSTYGNDCWDDGSATNAVAAGECYALVWKQNGATFAGLPMVPPNPNDPYALGEEVWLVDYFPVAELDEATGRMRCPEQTIGIGKLPLWETQNGTWTVYLLDTRYRLADGTMACGFDTAVTNAPQRINAYVAVPGLTDFTIGTTLAPAWETKVGGHEDGTPVVADAWNVRTCAVSFDAQGGTCAEAVRQCVSGDICGVLPNATRKGYGLLGWFAAPVGGDEISFDTVVTNNVTCYAHWQANEYTVDFNERGGEGEMDDQPMTYDEETELEANRFTRVGYTFLGWTDDPEELEDVLYYDGVVVSNLTDEAGGEYDLYAVWQANAYTVKFHANGGEGEMEPQAFFYGAKQSLSANRFENEDFGFVGWATAAGGPVAYRNGEEVSNLTDEPDGIVDLFAVWSEEPLPEAVVQVGVKTTIDTAKVFGSALKGYSVTGLPDGLKYDMKKGTISGTVSKATQIGVHRVKLVKDFDVYEMRIVVPELPTVDVVLWGDPASDTNGCKVTGAGAYQVGKKASLKLTLPKSTASRATVFEGWYLLEDEELIPWPNEKDCRKTSVSYKMTEESLALVAKVKVETTEGEGANVSVGCAGLSAHGGRFTAGLPASPDGIPLEIETASGEPKSVKVSGLPSGMKYDSKTKLITGVPTKAGEAKDVKIEVTTASGVKCKTTISVSIAALPEMTVGKFDGFVVRGEDNVGAVEVTTKADGKLSAKVVTASGSYSLSGTSWSAVTGTVYYATLKNGKKPETLDIRLDTAMAWNENQLGGTFSGNGFSLAVSAQREAFGQPWYFAASGNESTGWDLSFTNSTKGAAALTVTLKLDGKTTVAGTLVGTGGQKFKVSASGYANVCMMTNGAFVADFAPVVNKKVLSIRTNLWMDRSNDHKDAEDKPYIGFAAFVD